MQQPMAAQLPIDWNTGLCDCFEDASTCCYGFWCCPCLACTVSGRFGENSCLPLCDILTPAIMTACGIPCFVPPAVLSIRASIRNKYNIKGSLCKDIGVSCFCIWCSWCQMHRELKHRNKAPTTIVNVQTTNVSVQPNPVMMVPTQVGLGRQELCYSSNAASVNTNTRVSSSSSATQPPSSTQTSSVSSL